MAVIANHPDSRFPRAGVTVFSHDYMPALLGIDHELARTLEDISQSDPDREEGSTAYGHWRALGGEIGAGILVAAVPRKHRVTAGEETWLITYARGWVAAELHDSWEAAGAVYDRHATRMPPYDPGILVIERHGYWLAADWSICDKFTWYRPGTREPVPHAVDVWTNELADDPGIRVWAETQSDADPRICGLLAPELIHETLVGYQALADERGVSPQAMRSRVSYEQAAPTFPDVGALWSRVAARGLAGLEPEPSRYDVEVVHVGGSETQYHYETRKYAEDLAERDALDVLAKLRAEAETYGLSIKTDRAHRWHVNGAQAVEDCFLYGWVAEAKAVPRPPKYVWSAPKPITELSAPTKRGRPAKTRKPPRRRLLP
jgi:hypothetical protein